MERKGENLRQKRPVGITIIGIFLIVSSLWQMLGLVNASYYWYLFRPFPGKIIMLRYVFSWLLRITGFVCGAGLLRLNENSRRLTVYLSVFAIVAVPWKHPVFGFERHAAYLDRLLKNPGHAPLIVLGVAVPSFYSLAKVSALCMQAWEVLCAAAFIYYLTRPEVKKLFLKK
jgi:hypothetical protein